MSHPGLFPIRSDIAISRRASPRFQCGLEDKLTRKAANVNEPGCRCTFPDPVEFTADGSAPILDGAKFWCDICLNDIPPALNASIAARLGGVGASGNGQVVSHADNAKREDIHEADNQIHGSDNVV